MLAPVARAYHLGGGIQLTGGEYTIKLPRDRAYNRVILYDGLRLCGIHTLTIDFDAGPRERGQAVGAVLRNANRGDAMSLRSKRRTSLSSTQRQYVGKV